MRDQVVDEGANVTNGLLVVFFGVRLKPLVFLWFSLFLGGHRASAAGPPSIWPTFFPFV